ncbi:MAG: ribosome maturation factor RimP [Acidimicrobiales bacterium]
MDVEQRVSELLAPVVATLGVELVDVEFAGGTLRVVVDRPEDDSAPSDLPTPTREGDALPPGVTTAQLAEVNRLVSPLLDQHDPIPGRYTLEVSSPGLERPLRRPAHVRRAVGEDIIVKLAAPAEPRRLKGRLVEVADTSDAADDILMTIDAIEIDGVDLDQSERRTVALSDVASARTVFLWGPAPKPGRPKGLGGAGAKRQKAPKQNTSSRSRGTR